MADAKIITYGEAMGAGANVIADNLSPSLLVESVDDKDYIEIDTTNSAEKLILAGGGADVEMTNSASQFILPLVDRDATPMLAFGDGDTGFTEMVDDVLRFCAGGAARFTLKTTAFQASAGGSSPLFANEASTATNPVFVIGQDYLTTGLGGVPASNQVDLITAGTSRLSIDANGKIATGGETTALVDAGGIHIKIADSGVSALNADFKALFIEGGDDVGISIIAPTDKMAGIAFGDSGAHTAFTMQYRNVYDDMLHTCGVNYLSVKSLKSATREWISGSDHYYMPQHATATYNPAYLADSGSTLVIDFEKGAAATITLTDNIDTVKFIEAPSPYLHGLIATVTVRITQHASAAKTISYAASSTSVHLDSGTSAVTGELHWSGGVPHTMSTGTDDIDIVQFTIMALDTAGTDTYHVYGTVIGQDFQTV